MLTRAVLAASKSLLEAARAGQREAAERIGMWLDNTRADDACPQRLRRTIDRNMEIARGLLGGSGGDFSPIQPDDGEAA